MHALGRMHGKGSFVPPSVACKITVEQAHLKDLGYLVIWVVCEIVCDVGMMNGKG